MGLTAEQLEERKNYIGGSDAAAIMGLSRWGTPLSVWVTKTSETLAPKEESEAMYWGNKLEDVVSKEFSKVTGKQVEKCPRTYEHPVYPFIRANIDAIIADEKAILECKTCHALKASEWKDDEVPAEYILQCQHYLAVTGFAVAYIAVLIGGQKFVWKKIARDDDLIKKIIDAEVSFWNEFVVKWGMPMAMGADGDLLSEMFPNSVELKEIEVSPNIEKTLMTIQEGKDAIKGWEGIIDAGEAEIKQAMGDAESATIDGRVVARWKTAEVSRVDTKRLKAEAPGIADEYTVMSTQRRFLIKKGG